ncbi:KpsF/GutQ family sugar-phosphate isomerase [Roseomonas sp. E05]|uniref:KpsF/GutQ family sugar-phosphate isomerase n=1 Tax=Roseomonas sp. E05 TaxID=3046310 RepID=UPI0024B9A793|nr:KpsF/GutQ family sugar-phosphate isomerase [Roseomonas sp. E05]MDJ0389015.1 KpsF/GutQ family sugar-phosphate isomerase [Roseomonas sp. E05]
MKAAILTIATERDGLKALEDALKGPLAAPFEQAIELLRAVRGRVIISGMGKSGHVGRKIAATMASTGTPAQFVHPGEASHGDLGMIQSGDAVIALSWSGETPELNDLVAHTRRFSIPLIAMTSKLDSALGSAADTTFALPRMAEACPNGLAPTTSTTMLLALGDALAVALLQARGFTASDFKVFHPGGKLGAQLKRVSDIARKLAEVPHVGPEESVGDALVSMSRFGLGYVLVVHPAGDLAGIVTDGDIRRHMAPELVTRTVSEIMTARPTTLRADLLAGEGLSILNRLKITAAPVVAGEVLIGGIHLNDFINNGVV